MTKEVIDFNVVKDREDRRAKHLSFSINNKKIDFPLKAANVNKSNHSENIIAKEEIDKKVLNEIDVRIYPKKLVELVSNSSAHQKLKDEIRRVLQECNPSGQNFVYPILLNQRVPNESEQEFEGFRKPNIRVIEKLFDLFDIEEIDILAIPVALNNQHEYEWSRIATEVFTKRSPDYIRETILSGVIPNSVSESTAKTMLDDYLRHGFQSITFDFFNLKIQESRIRSIIDHCGDKWEQLHVHGTRVPHFNWHGTHLHPTLPTYDLLISVYGFDSYGGILASFGDTDPSKIHSKISTRRYRITDTYGTYKKDGLATYLDNHDYSCKCPVCRRIKSPLDLYNIKPNIEEYDELHNKMRTHRLHVTHKEMNRISDLIDKNTYHEYISEKSEASRELTSMLSRQYGMSDFF